MGLTKKQAKFKWTECKTAFEYFKDSLSTVTVPAYSSTRKSYMLYTDTSEEYVCISLCQVHSEANDT